jgi:hypothetical protein
LLGFLIHLAFSASAPAQLVVNSPQPITRQFLVQIIDTAADDGSSAAPLFGTPSQQAAIFSDVDQVWAQAGIQVSFEFLPSTWDSTFALTGTAGAGNPRPATDLSAIVTAADSTLRPDTRANQLFMLQIVPTFAQQSADTAAGDSFTNFNGMTLWIGPELPVTTAGQDLAASILAHEIGRNLGLTTDNTDSQDLMGNGGSGGDLLTQTQVTAARDSQFITVIPEPSSFSFLVAAAVLLFARPSFRKRCLTRG